MAESVTIARPYAEAAFKLKKDEVTAEPVRTQFGFHVIRVEDKRSKKPPTFEEAEEEVRMAARRDLAESYVSTLREKAKIETFGMEGRPAKGAAPKAEKGDSKKK